MTKGKITAILGSMRSSKSSALFDVADKAKYRKKRLCFIRPNLDTRDFVARSTDRDLAIISCDKLADQFAYVVQNYDIVCIDEGQFFPDLGSVCHELALNDKEVFVAALNGDSEMKPWTSVSELIPYVDEIRRVSGVCEDCNEDRATFSFYSESKKSQIIVGDGEYSVLCRKCHNKRTTNKENQ